MRTSLLAVILLTVSAAVSSASRAQTSDANAALEQTAECMLQVLKEIPEVSEPKLGVTTSDGWSRPYLEYRGAEVLSSSSPIRFNAKKADHGGYWFEAVKSGFGAPEFHVTDAVMRKWKARCSIDAVVRFP
jgi:acyl-CoA reductase-like NAD-dependent aldehyde dehydrogenase